MLGVRSKPPTHQKSSSPSCGEELRAFPGRGALAEEDGCLRCVVDAAEADEGEAGPQDAPGCLGGVVGLVAGHAEVADGTADEGFGLLSSGHGAGALRGEAADGLQVVDAVGDGAA